jgi:hypothetical protein
MMDTWLLAAAGNLSGVLFRVLGVIVGFAVVYFGHELGHLLAAKACRVKFTNISGSTRT